MNISTGQVYKHYKGNPYKIIALAKHSETLEEMVVYQDQNEPEKVWVRPRALFESDKIIDGKKVQRFTKITGF